MSAQLCCVPAVTPASPTDISLIAIEVLLLVVLPFPSMPSLPVPQQNNLNPLALPVRLAVLLPPLAALAVRVDAASVPLFVAFARTWKVQLAPPARAIPWQPFALANSKLIVLERLVLMTLLLAQPTQLVRVNVV